MGNGSNFSKIDGVAQIGTKLAMKMPGMSFGSTVTAATPHQKLEWAAWIINKTIFEGRHTFTLTTNPDGSTHLDNFETFSGGLVWPFQSLFKSKAGGRGNGYDGFKQAFKKINDPHFRRRWLPAISKKRTSVSGLRSDCPSYCLKKIQLLNRRDDDV